jgi:hypothetical protein
MIVTLLIASLAVVLRIVAFKRRVAAMASSMKPKVLRNRNRLLGRLGYQRLFPMSEPLPGNREMDSTARRTVSSSR